MILFDGREWEKAPDFGSFKPIKILPKDRHIYKGLSTDLDKLPKYVGSGSLATCIDTGEEYEFEETTKTWYKKKVGVANGSTASENDMYVENGSLVIEVDNLNP